MKQEFDDIDDLIAKVLAGEANAEELSRVQLWASAHAENQKQLDQFKLLFEKAASPIVQQQFDTDTAWLKLKERLKKGTGRTVQMPTQMPMFRIAASIAIIVTVGVLAFRFFNPKVDSYAMTTQTEKVQDTLPDGSKAFLNDHSEVQYEFNHRKKIRKVKLKGEGYFEVKHDEEMPFQIETGNVIVEDLGTAFNIKAYPASDSIEVIVREGEVKFYTLEDEGLHLQAGESGVYLKQKQEFFKVEKIDSNALAYKTGVLNFNNADLKTVIGKINEVYRSKISLKNPAIEQCKITVSFKNEKLDIIVEVIAETLHLTVEREKNRIILNGTSCQ